MNQGRTWVESEESGEPEWNQAGTQCKSQGRNWFESGWNQSGTKGVEPVGWHQKGGIRMELWMGHLSICNIRLSEEPYLKTLESSKTPFGPSRPSRWQVFLYFCFLRFGLGLALASLGSQI